MATQQIGNQGLTQKARENLERNEQIRRSMGDSRYIHLEDKQDVVLLFDAEKMTSVEKDSRWQPGKKQIQFEYTVVDPNDPAGRERLFTTSKRWSEQIDALLMAGEGTRRLLKIKRIGLNKDTIYYIESA